MRPSFTPRRRPLEPIAVAARGDAAQRLQRRLLTASDEVLERLEGVAGPELLLVLGPADLLPWVDGAIYLGRDPGAPSLAMPTTHQPSCPPALLERALNTRGFASPLAILLEPPLVVPLRAARPIARATLEAWAPPAAGAAGRG